MAKLSSREQAAKKLGVAVDYTKSASQQGKSSSSKSSVSSGLKAPSAPKTGSFKFDSSKLVPTYQAEAASIYNPQIKQIEGLQALTKAQSEDAKVKTKDEFAQLLKREQENINRRGAFFSGGGIDQENRIRAQEGGALRDIGYQEQSANLQYQGTLSEIAQAQKDYVSSKVEGAYSSAYKTFQDQIANKMNQYQLELGQYNQDRAFEQSKIESDRNYALSASANARAGAGLAMTKNQGTIMADAQNAMLGARGEDGKTDPSVYAQQKSNYLKAGGSGADFDAQYGNLLSPAEQLNLGLKGGTTELTASQANQFNSIVGKYNASPLVAAADRTVVLKNSIKGINEDPSNGAKQLNLAYSYIQALDTYQSSVREGELSLVNSIDSKAGQVQNYVQQIQNGQIVRPEVAKQIAEAASNVVSTIEEGAKNKAKSFESQANTIGLGDQWRQYQSGFQQSYNVNATNNPADLNDDTLRKEWEQMNKH